MTEEWVCLYMRIEQARGVCVSGLSSFSREVATLMTIYIEMRSSWPSLASELTNACEEGFPYPGSLDKLLFGDTL